VQSHFKAELGDMFIWNAWLEQSLHLYVLSHYAEYWAEYLLKDNTKSRISFSQKCLNY
jgi:hypothetical protein